MLETRKPGPEHPIDCLRSKRRVRVLFDGHLLADSEDVVILREPDQPPRYYFPVEDVEMEVLTASERHTQCPYKGEASYFTLYRDGQVVDDAAWMYPAPDNSLSQIAGRVCFSEQVVEFETDPVFGGAGEQARRMSDYIRHTDSGAGTSQAAHWPPNVDTP